MFPFLLVATLKESWYPFFFRLARIWAKVILVGMGFRVVKTAEQQIKKRESYMFIANHTSMTDIMLMLRATKKPVCICG
jgi:1-acyl-sn-glycerol-3-phosphate acyltransferase